MKLARTVVQEAKCSCNNWCNNGRPTPYPLRSRITPDENILGDYCETCSFLDWINTKTLNYTGFKGDNDGGK